MEAIYGNADLTRVFFRAALKNDRAIYGHLADDVMRVSSNGASQLPSAAIAPGGGGSTWRFRIDATREIGKAVMEMARARPLESDDSLRENLTMGLSGLAGYDSSQKAEARKPTAAQREEIKKIDEQKEMDANQAKRELDAALGAATGALAPQAGEVYKTTMKWAESALKTTIEPFKRAAVIDFMVDAMLEEIERGVPSADAHKGAARPLSIACLRGDENIFHDFGAALGAKAEDPLRAGLLPFSDQFAFPLESKRAILQEMQTNGSDILESGDFAANRNALIGGLSGASKFEAKKDEASAPSARQMKR